MPSLPRSPAFVRRAMWRATLVPAAIIGVTFLLVRSSDADRRGSILILVLLACIAWQVWLLRPAYRLRRVAEAHDYKLCGQCGYPMADAARCPECGGARDRRGWLSWCGAPDESND